MSKINLANTQFQRFVDFAGAQPDSIKSKAVATAGLSEAGQEGKLLADRAIAASRNDSVGKISRQQAVKDANDEVRSIFRDAIAEMFGGDNKIPQSVKKAMKLGDYGRGKPLTARRIMAVNAAIEKLLLGNLEMDDAFESPEFGAELKILAKNNKHVATDFKKLNTAGNLLSKATGMTLRGAMEEVLDKKSTAFSVSQCGDLYTGSVEAFRTGLQLHGRYKTRTEQILKGVASGVKSGDVKKFAAVATLRAEQLKETWKEVEAAFAMQNRTGKGDAKYKEAKQAFAAAIALCEKTAKDVSKGRLADGKAVFDAFITSSVFHDADGKLRDLAKELFKAAKKQGGTPAQTAASSSIAAISNRFNAETQNIAQTFRDTLATREVSRLAKVFASAERAAGVKMHPHFVKDAAVYIKQFDYQGVEALEQMAAKFKTESALVRFTPEQKQRLRKVVESQIDAKDAGKALDRFVSDIENCALCNAFTRTMSKQPWSGEMIENLVRHFEENPKLADQFAIGYKEESAEDFKADIKRNLKQNFLNAMERPEGELSSLKSGMMPQSIREYNKGYVTFEGEEIPDATTGKDYFMADSLSRKGFAEFLENKFDDEHVQMRRMVSFVCGMADGLGGVISAAFNGSGNTDPKLLKTKPRNSDEISIDARTTVRAGERSPDENYDISIDKDTGDVTVKLTHYEDTRLYQYSDRKYNSTPFANAEKEPPRMGAAKFEVAIKIRNQPDARLGEDMPEFEVVGLTQQAI